MRPEWPSGTSTWKARQDSRGLRTNSPT
jgi:hypothetical protein